MAVTFDYGHEDRNRFMQGVMARDRAIGAMQYQVASEADLWRQYEHYQPLSANVGGGLLDQLKKEGLYYSGSHGDYKIWDNSQGLPGYVWDKASTGAAITGGAGLVLFTAGMGKDAQGQFHWGSVQETVKRVRRHERAHKALTGAKPNVLTWKNFFTRKAYHIFRYTRKFGRKIMRTRWFKTLQNGFELAKGHGRTFLNVLRASGKTRWLATAIRTVAVRLVPWALTLLGLSGPQGVAIVTGALIVGGALWAYNRLNRASYNI